MIIYTDNPEYATNTLIPSIAFHQHNPKTNETEYTYLIQRFFTDGKIYETEYSFPSIFTCLFVKQFSPSSQFDQLIEYSRRVNQIKGGILCFSGSGKDFHGFHQREWASLDGNIHLSILLQPERRVDHANAAFLILAANAVTKTINDLEKIQSKASIHWVNDILIEQQKVSGVLVQSQVRGEITEKVVIGIGINVEKKPELRSDPFVKAATAINCHVENKKHYVIREILWPLVINLEKQYVTLMENRYFDLLDSYIKHSLIIGKVVEVYSDPREGSPERVTMGKVISITEDLELILEGVEHPVRKGRVKIFD
ncbi:Bifunctional ligase/repressor BirA [subsurface metagenome]